MWPGGKVAELVVGVGVGVAALVWRAAPAPAPASAGAGAGRMLALWLSHLYVRTFLWSRVAADNEWEWFCRLLCLFGALSFLLPWQRQRAEQRLLCTGLVLWGATAAMLLGYGTAEGGGGGYAHTTADADRRTAERVLRTLAYLLVQGVAEIVTPPQAPWRPLLLSVRSIWVLGAPLDPGMLACALCCAAVTALLLWRYAEQSLPDSFARR